MSLLFRLSFLRSILIAGAMMTVLVNNISSTEGCLPRRGFDSCTQSYFRPVYVLYISKPCNAPNTIQSAVVGGSDILKWSVYSDFLAFSFDLDSIDFRKCS